MQLNHLEQVIEYSNELDSIDAMFGEIEQTLDDSIFVLSHLNIDGEEVFEDYYDYIRERLTGIQVITTILITKEQLVHERIVMMFDYLSESIPHIKPLADRYYLANDEEVWKGLQWIDVTLLTIDNLGIADYAEKMSGKREQMGEIVGQMDSAVMNKDKTYIGDLLQYEVIPFLQSVKEIASQIIDSEVVRDDLN
jgi:hypothetical protein